MTSRLNAKVDAALDRYLRAPQARREGRGTFEEFRIWAMKQDLFNAEDGRELVGKLFDDL